MGEVNQYRLASSLFLRCLGIFYLIAFVSLAVQVEGLAGSHGILPFAEILQQRALQPGISKYIQAPTLFWLNSNDTALIGACILGAISALFIIINRGLRLALILNFALYLSLYHATKVFLNFQWDGLLLEAGFLAIFLSPNERIVVFLYKLLLFKLRFMSGLSKIVSGDTGWWPNLTALNSYFETQPLPSPLAWYFHHLPDWLLKAGTAGTLFVELLVPFFMFLPRRWRHAAAWLTILWQVLIILSSNHNWFNFLTIALCLFLFDDQALSRFIPGGIRHQQSASTLSHFHSIKQSGTILLAITWLFVGGLHFAELVRMQQFRGVFGSVLDYAETWRVDNKYHVFPKVNTERVELELWGTADGKEWKPYIFKYRPYTLDRAPAFVIPHQPRLDWRMWFVPLHPVHVPWFVEFLKKLMANEQAVVDLLAENPFPDTPPKYIRVEALRYQFTTPEEHKQTGNWWKKEYLGPFDPVPWIAQPAAAQPEITRPSSPGNFPAARTVPSLRPGYDNPSTPASDHP